MIATVRVTLEKIDEDFETPLEGRIEERSRPSE